MTQDIFYCASNSAYILRDIRVSEGQDQKGEGGGGGGGQTTKRNSRRIAK